MEDVQSNVGLKVTPESIVDIINELLGAAPSTVSLRIHSKDAKIGIDVNGKPQVNATIQQPTNAETLLDQIKPKIPKGYVIRGVLKYPDGDYIAIISSPTSS